MILPEGRSLELSEALLVDAIDIHVHAGPHISSSPRRVDPVQAAIQARDAGMRAIVFMDVFEMSNGTAWIVNRVVRDFQTYGGLILNTVYGGMNPRAVRTALEYGDGARFISFGAHSTYFQASKEGRVVDGRFVPLSEIYPRFADELSRTIRIPVDAPPTPELQEILELIAARPEVYLNTGHVSNEEAARLVDLAAEFGIARVLVASSVTKNLSIPEQQALAEKGALLEHTLAAFTHTTPIPKTHYYVEREFASLDEGMDETAQTGVRGVAEQIAAVGAAHCVIGSDFGVYTLPTPVEGFRAFIACLLDLGIGEDDIRTLTVTNPGWLLGLNAR